MTTQRTRLHIERLALDLRGISPEKAHAVADALGPALRQAMAVHSQAPRSAASLDGGRIASAAAPDATALAARIAQRVAGTVKGGGS